MDNVTNDNTSFKISRQIGSGASAQVYEAVNVERSEIVALKVIATPNTKDDEVFKRFRREANLLQSLQHQNVVRLFQFWETADKFFMELEFVDGRSLRQWLAEEAETLIEQRLWILAQICQALGATHAEGIIHRDLKPDNVLIGWNGDTKLSDFGLAKIEGLQSRVTQQGVLIGSLAYMSPEAINGSEVAYKSDLFSFGIVAYETLTGKHPFPHQDAQTLFKSITTVEAPLCHIVSPKIPLNISKLIHQCLAKDIASRPESIWNIHSTIMNYLSSTGLLPMCRKLVAKNDCASDALASAYAVKYQTLTKTINFQLDQKPRDQKQIVSLINEFIKLFPQSENVASYMNVVRTRPAKNIANAAGRVWLFLTSTLLIIVAAYFCFFSQKSTNTSKMVIVKSNVTDHEASTNAAETMEAELPQEKPQNVFRRRAASANKVEKAAKPENAHLSVFVDSDVKVFIDGRRYSKAELQKFEINAGEHRILMEKEGFLPIEKVLTIKSGETKIVHARGDSHE
jgi:serine/threonine protein kinase